MQSATEMLCYRWKGGDGVAQN